MLSNKALKTVSNNASKSVNVLNLSPFFQVRRQSRQHIQVKIDDLQNESRDITEFQINIAVNKTEQL